MPNYVTSTCHITGDPAEIERFKATIIVDAPDNHSDCGGQLFDFNAVIPMPASVKNTESGSTAEIGMALIIARGSQPAPFANLGLYEVQIGEIRRRSKLGLDASIKDVAAEYLKLFPDTLAAGQAQLSALVETGFVDWYSWACHNWGTKWGAFRFDECPCEEGYLFRFETAWAFPTPIFEKLVTDFPSVHFHCHTFDEGWNFAGAGWFNAPDGQPAFTTCKPTDELYEAVYGHAPDKDEDEETVA